MRRMDLILCEATGRWAAALCCHLPPAVRIAQTRSSGEMLDQVGESPDAVVALELAAGREQAVLNALVRLAREFPRSRAIVLADGKMGVWEYATREAGAIHFIETPRRLQEVVEIIDRKSASRLRSFQEDENLTLEERILANLPWSA